ncbi:MAG: hypothetical protein N2235_19475 [Fischerella sp.]|nr:hypothetical protein [Fischerella sp.]
MLKNLLLSGWFRVQPFLIYVAVVTLIAPLMATSSHSTSARSQAAKNTSVTMASDSVLITASANQAATAKTVSKVATTSPLVDKPGSVITSGAVVDELQILQIDNIESWTAKDDSLSTKGLPNSNSLTVSLSQGLSTSQLGLVERLKLAKLQSLPRENNYLSMDKPAAESPKAATIAPVSRESQPDDREVPVTEESEQTQTQQQDPIGSPHPVPWDWILTTHQTISSQGVSGVRYYRSLPVVSPDGRYAVYSRVQLEVKPELYNSRVSSVLFIEDRQTRKLRVLSSTSRNMDALLNTKADQDANGEGTIGVLVPVSWSESGDRFLARQFEGVFNTSDATDRALIWDRQSDRTNTVSPTSEEQEHEKIAVLLGWSKSQPSNVLFRTGEIGQEDWLVLAVSDDGRTVIATQTDRPVTFGKKVKEVWGKPQVAYR